MSDQTIVMPFFWADGRMTEVSVVWPLMRYYKLASVDTAPLRLPALGDPLPAPDYVPEYRQALFELKLTVHGGSPRLDDEDHEGVFRAGYKDGYYEEVAK